MGSFARQKVLVVGDVMIDAYLWGNVERISPESPVPVVEIKTTEDRLGGAANVALNIKALDATPLLCSVVGTDRDGDLFIELMKEKGLSPEGIIQWQGRQTTIKTRVLCRNHQMIRFDRETTTHIEKGAEEQLIQNVERLLDEVDVVLLQDYNKGILTPYVIQKIIAAANAKGKVTAVDPKKKHFFEYKNVTLFKPNLKEIIEGMNVEIDSNNIKSLDDAAELLNQKLGNKYTFITLSDKGIYIKNGNKSKIVPAHVRNIADVSGAGDTVISIAAMALAAGFTPELAAALANVGGGLVCEEVGVIPVNKKRFREEAEKLI